MSDEWEMLDLAALTAASSAAILSMISTSKHSSWGMGYTYATSNNIAFVTGAAASARTGSRLEGPDEGAAFINLYCYPHNSG